MEERKDRKRKRERDLNAEQYTGICDNAGEENATCWLKVVTGSLTLPNMSPELYANLFSFLLCDDVDGFFKDCWENRPCLFRRNSKEFLANATSAASSSSKKMYSDMLSKRSFMRVVDNRRLSYDTNMKIMRYDGSDRILWNKQCRTRFLSSKDVKRIFDDGFTIQLFQPQRFSDGLWQICSSFERYFQSLAGASAYMTPPHSQGLPPHYDDVEVFVLQTEGTKTWRLWRAVLLLTETHSDSIPREALPSEKKGN